MTQTEERVKKPKKKVNNQNSRTVIMTCRLSPPLRFVAELMARHQHRTVSSLMESLLAEKIDQLLSAGGVDRKGTDRPLPVRPAPHGKNQRPGSRRTTLVCRRRRPLCRNGFIFTEPINRRGTGPMAGDHRHPLLLEPF